MLTEAATVRNSCSDEADHQKCNRSSSRRARLSRKFKTSIIEFYEAECNGESARFAKVHRLECKHIKIISSCEKGWKFPSARERILKEVPDNKQNQESTCILRRAGKVKSNEKISRVIRAICKGCW